MKRAAPLRRPRPPVLVTPAPPIPSHPRSPPPSHPRPQSRHTRACRGYLAVTSTNAALTFPPFPPLFPVIPARSNSVIPALAAGISP